MRVLIVSANRELINMRVWPLGPACVATALLKAGYDVELLDLMQSSYPDKAIRTAIATFQPDVIGVSVRNVDDQSSQNTQFFLDDVRERILFIRALTNAPVVIGGAGYSIFPSAMLEYLGADIGIQGEGETAFVSLVRRLERGEGLAGLSGIFLRNADPQGERAFVADLDDLPLPDSRFMPDAALANDEEFWLPVQTRRGCAMRCSYCSTATIEGCTVRKRSPRKIVEWLTQTAARFRRYHFVDNTFNLPPSYARSLCSALLRSKLDIMWRCILYPLRLDGELARLMRASGCKEVSVGFESGSQPILHGLNKRFRPNDVRMVCETLKENGIARIGFLLLGGPGETKETALESLAFADSLDLECMKLTVGIRIYPDTALFRTAIADGIVNADDDLLEPRFYVAKGLENWLQDTVAHWMSTRPNWIS